MKSEPTAFSINDLKRCKTTCWDGVRNYQARNFLRDAIRVGDGVLFYHSSVDQVGIVGMAEVTKAGYPDYTAWDPHGGHYDPKSTPARPIWYMVDIRFVKTCREIITLTRLRAIPHLKKMMLLRQGRLSVQPVTPQEWAIVTKLPEWAGRASQANRK